MSQIPSPPPASLPEQEALYRRSRYRRPRSPLAWWAVLVGLALGISAGLYVSWVLFPTVETDTTPDQLREQDRNQVVVAIMLSFSYDSDLGLAISRLSELQLGDDPLQAVADIACDLARSGYVDSNAGLRAVRAMRTFYRLQGRSGCADTLIPDVTDPQEIIINVPTSTPTLPPPPTKTPGAADATATPAGLVVVPTTPPQSEFEGSIFQTFCDRELSGIIEVFVRAVGDTEGIAGQTIRVRWDAGSDTLITGLKPERGAGYADFQMEAGLSYTISMPGLSDPVASPIVAERCFTDDGSEAITSYRVAFVRRIE
jgi:hypothetical protein